MKSGDFYGNEKSVTMEDGGDFSIVLEKKDGSKVVLKDKLKAAKGEVLDATFMSKKALRAFIAEQIEDAKQKGFSSQFTSKLP